MILKVVRKEGKKKKKIIHSWGKRLKPIFFFGRMIDTGKTSKNTAEREGVDVVIIFRILIEKDRSQCIYTQVHSTWLN